MTRVLWLNEVGASNLSVVGGKGANLGEAIGAGLPVPPGFVITTTAYDEFVGPRQRAVILGALAELDVDDTVGLQEAARSIQEALSTAGVPAGVAAAAQEAYARLGGGLVAVRSSATAEDLPGASFAGQQATLLNVHGADALLEAIRLCWASLFEARAIFYRAQAGWGPTDARLAVVVQRMIQAETAGVLFTADVATNDLARITIEAGYGLGEAVVSGQITPDHYVVEKESGRLLQADVARQARRLVLTGGHAGTGAEWVAVPAELQAKQKLDAAQIQALAELGRRVERHFGAPQDIEWAWAEGQAWLLQARPITAVGRPVGRTPAPPAARPVRVSGAAASPGIAAGPVRLVRGLAELGELHQGDVLVAEMTTPDFVPAMRRAAAIVTDHGGRTCHAAIVSRELGVPCVVGAGDASAQLADGHVVTVDGCAGRVYEGEDAGLLAWWAEQRARTAPIDAPPQTRTKLCVNLADPAQATHVAAMPVDGVGLLRAEFLVASLGKHPRRLMAEGAASQYVAHLRDGMREIAAAFDPRPVVYRATDFKTNEYANLAGGEEYEPAESNPMIGYRGAVRYLQEPDLFRLELEAIAQVRARHANLHLMIPFVRTPDELRAVIALIDESGVRSSDLQIWMMVEVPSNVLLLDAFLDAGVDGISIGSNDLTQLILGVDRDNEHLGDMFDERDPAVQVALESVIGTARRRDIPVSICGQGPAEHPDLAEKLVTWGITSISVTPDAVEQTRRAVAAAEARLAGAMPTPAHPD